MKHLPLLLAALLFALAVAGCKTDAQGNTVPDWEVIDTELDLLSEDLILAASAFPDHAEDYHRLAATIAQVDLAVEALEAGNVVDLTSARGAIDLALAALTQFEGEEWAFIAGATLRRIKAYLPEEVQS